jgi:hypothetical protein
MAALMSPPPPQRPSPSLDRDSKGWQGMSGLLQDLPKGSSPSPTLSSPPPSKPPGSSPELELILADRECKRLTSELEHARKRRNDAKDRITTVGETAAGSVRQGGSGSSGPFSGLSMSMATPLHSMTVQLPEGGTQRIVKRYIPTRRPLSLERGLVLRVLTKAMAQAFRLQEADVERVMDQAVETLDMRDKVEQCRVQVQDGAGKSKQLSRLRKRDRERERMEPVLGHTPDSSRSNSSAPSDDS